MYTYFVNTDITFTTNVFGELSFDRKKIYNKMAKLYTMPTMYKDIIESTLSDELLNKSNSLADVASIVNTVVTRLNKTLVPIMRASIYNNSELKTLINLKEFIEDGDIFISFRRNSDMQKPVSVDIIDVTNIFRKLEKYHVEFTEEQMESINSNIFNRINQYVENMSLTDININGNEMVDTVGDYAYSIIESVLYENMCYISYFKALDCDTNVEYISLDNDMNLTLNKSNVAIMLDAMGFNVYSLGEGIHPEISKCISEMEETLQSDIKEYINKNNRDGYDISLLCMNLNTMFINNIKFMVDNNIPLCNYTDIDFPDVLLSQNWFNSIYHDGIAMLLCKDRIIDDLKTFKGIPKSDSESQCETILNECKAIYKMVSKDNNAVDIYKSLRMTYLDMLNRAKKPEESKKGFKLFQDLNYKASIESK